MIVLPGYTIVEEIISGLSTTVYRGIRSCDLTSVIIKILKSLYPSIEEITRLKQEYYIVQKLEFDQIVKVYSLEKYQSSFALILEDFGGQSLKEILKSQQLAIDEVLRIGILLADTLDYLHKKSIIHKDIKPSNIIINRETGAVKLTDFSIASSLSQENTAVYISNLQLLEGTLAYMSPEQTGRMNRAIDYRTDFYSLGVTLYEILTGQLPFTTTDPVELVHCHIAKQPVPPRQCNSEIPKAVSDLVLKLISKNPEARYQNALGIKHDLEFCLNQKVATGKIPIFKVGSRDSSSQICIPQKLYGREKEVTELLESFKRITNTIPADAIEKNVRSEMMLVSGYSGIGKTAIINEIHQPVLESKGYFVSGKFDRFKRNIPYAALIQAFQELSFKLLTESPEKTVIWKEKILNALGQNGQVIIDVIPEVELIIGKQPTVAKLGLSESQNRLILILKKFIHVFCQPEHPLVIFLDDLQWKDSASLKLIELLMSDPASQYLLIIGAYRDNEVSPTHPLMQAIEKIQKVGVTVSNIILNPLTFQDVTLLISETLKESGKSKRLKPLVELIFNKTQGNPFFVTQILKTLYSENLLHYDFNAGKWQWDIEQIQAIGITDYSVVELMARNIQRMPLETQEILKVAACIGNQFNLEALAIVNEKSQPATAAYLWDALQAGLVLPLNNAYKIPMFDSSNISVDSTDIDPGQLTVQYKFLHDRVQQAAYSLIPETEKKATHLKIGKLLLQNSSPKMQKENIFALANQLNFALELLTTQSEKYEVANLNLIAGQKAKAAMAYEAALNYLNIGLELRLADSWNTHYNLTIDLYVEAAEAAYSNTNFELANSHAEIVLQKAKNLLDKVKAYELKIQMYMIQMQMKSALDTGLSVLEMLGVSLEKQAPSNIAIEELIELPEMTDPYKLTAMRSLMNVMSPAYMVNPALMPSIAFTMISLSIKYGNCGISAYGYVVYALLLSGIFLDIDTGYRYGQLALKLVDKFDARNIQCKILQIFNGHVKPWKDPVRSTIEPLENAIQCGLETGDIEYAGYCVGNYCCHVFFVGENLEIIENKLRQYIQLMEKLKQELAIIYPQITRQVILNLIGESENKLQLEGSAFKESELVPILRQANHTNLLFWVYLAKTRLAYLFKKPAIALENARKAEEYLPGVVGLVLITEHNFYYSLALLALYPDAAMRHREQILLQVVANQEKMKFWAVGAPSNFQNKYDLVEAEKAKVLGQITEAIAFYEQAISGAKNQGYIQEEALANELAGEFHLSRQQENLARFYITESYYGYIHWGAKAKVKDLESRYPQLISRNSQPSTIVDIYRTTTSTSNKVAESIDLATVMKASLAISAEIVPHLLLKKLIEITMENAGAQTGFLLLDREGTLAIEAAGKIEGEKAIVSVSPALEISQFLPMTVVNYVQKTQTYLVLNDAKNEDIFNADPYIIKNKPKSVLCTPIVKQGKPIGLFYLENNLTTAAFTSQRVEIIALISSQAAISLENSHLYAKLETANKQLAQSNLTLEIKVNERTLELQSKNEHLLETLERLQRTQAQIIQSEKMSSLGQLVAGIAHEINNPTNFIYGNLNHANNYVEQLLNLLELYQKTYSNPTSEIVDRTEEIDLNFVKEDLPKLLKSMKVGSDRIREIVLSLRNFSRHDESEMKLVDIHSGIDSTLLILQHRLHPEGENKKIQTIEQYGNLPKIECYAGQLNQVFMNIISNAIEALEMVNEPANDRPESPTIWISTELVENERVVIRIADNGPGVSSDVLNKIFDPFFTTKPVGKATGLGLSIAHDIVVKKHQGKLQCTSSPYGGAEFAIEIPFRKV